jgi:crotonobetainyl-CoA:carnitine CoA-transferase CaiB-like acyl-CoA transferase
MSARPEVDAALAAWTGQRSPRQVAERLQAAGVPAGMMQRIPDYLDDPQFVHRRFLTELSHPLLVGLMPTERAPARFDRLPDPELRPAPLAGEQTRDIAKRLLGLDDDEIETLLAAGVLEVAAINPILGASRSPDDEIPPGIGDEQRSNS